MIDKIRNRTREALGWEKPITKLYPEFPIFIEQLEAYILKTFGKNTRIDMRIIPMRGPCFVFLDLRSLITASLNIYWRYAEDMNDLESPQHPICKIILKNGNVHYLRAASKMNAPVFNLHNLPPDIEPYFNGKEMISVAGLRERIATGLVPPWVEVFFV